MNKILLIPGSFNPITNAHVDMALAAKKADRKSTRLNSSHSRKSRMPASA